MNVQKPVPTAKLLDFRQEVGPHQVYAFRVTARGDDFRQAITALKTAVPFTQRSYDSEDRTWRVKANEANEQALCNIFVNAEHCLTLVKSQLRLF